jgi:hypothetical protein
LEFHLDYISCVLTIAATVLIGRKSWLGLVIAAINSAIVCVIGVRTAQFGFIPANLFCIGIYAVSIRSWLRTRAENLQTQADGETLPVAESTS